MFCFSRTAFIFLRLRKTHYHGIKDERVVARCYLDEENRFIRKKRFDTGEDMEQMYNSLCSGEVSVNSMQPLHIISNWVELETTTKVLFVAIILPSGTSTGKFTVRVSKDGCALEVKMKWFYFLVDVEHLYKKWLCSEGFDHLEVYHPKMIFFENILKSFRSDRSDLIESTSRINLHFQVQTLWPSNIIWHGLTVKPKLFF